jgi:hypothetical protein
MSAAVHVQLQLRIVGDDGTVFTDSEILCLEKSAERLEESWLWKSEHRDKWSFCLKVKAASMPAAQERP